MTIYHYSGLFVVNLFQKAHYKKCFSAIYDVQSQACLNQKSLLVYRSHYFPQVWIKGRVKRCYIWLVSFQGRVFWDKLEDEVVVELSIDLGHYYIDIFIEKMLLLKTKKVFCFWVAVDDKSELLSDWIQCNHTVLINRYFFRSKISFSLFCHLDWIICSNFISLLGIQSDFNQEMKVVRNG